MTEHHFHRHQKNNKFKKITFVLFIFAVIGSLWFILRNPDAQSVVEPIVKENPDKNIPKKDPNREKPYIFIAPEKIHQGELALISLEGVTNTADVESLTIDGRPLYVFLHEGQVTALFGVDLYAKPGTFPVVMTFKDGRQIKEDLTILALERDRRPFDIPEKLGGNTYESVQNLKKSLSEEGKIINNLPVVWEKLWTEKFDSPFKKPFEVSDEYGYTRIIGDYLTMPHKGTDIEAPIGTPIYSMNRGIVKYVGDLRNYGTTVVVDHGAGLQTVYMHLSEAKVVLDQAVEKGELIALSGDSGYTLDPHLHLTIRIWDISIDPMKFLELLGS